LSATIDTKQVALGQAQAQVAALTAQMNALKADPAFTHYLVIRSKVRTGAVVLTDDQQAGFAQMESRFGPTAQALETAASEKRPLAKALAELQSQLKTLTDERAAILADCRCQIAHVDGDTIVRSTTIAHEDLDVSQLPGEAITQTFIRNGASVNRVFSAAQGRVDWALAL
jgi:cell division protein FtsB